MPKQHRGVDGGDTRRSVVEVALEFVHIVDPLSAPVTVLAVNRIDVQTAGTDTKDQRILR